MNIETILKKYNLLPGNTQTIEFGDLLILLKRKEQGWFIYSGLKNDEEKNPEPEEGDYFQSGASNALYLAPALPNKPLVFKGNKLSVTPGEKLTFFIKIPLIVQIYHSSKKSENLIKEIAHTRLSDTWFGEPVNGEPAFSIGTDFYLDVKDTNLEIFEAICPISVFNNSDKLLEIQNLIIRVEHLNLYLYHEKVISSIVKIEYKGKDAISSADYGYPKTWHGEKQQIIAKPRSDSNSNSLKINFHFIRNIYKNM